MDWDDLLEHSEKEMDRRTRRIYEGALNSVDRILEEDEDLLEYNPYHDRQGKFTGMKYLKVDKAGSKSGMEKGKWFRGGYNAKKKGARFLKKHSGGVDDCGRPARKKGKATRCWDGKEPGWFTGRSTAKSMMGKKRMKRNEDLLDDIYALLSEWHDESGDFFFDGEQD